MIKKILFLTSQAFTNPLYKVATLVFKKPASADSFKATQEQSLKSLAGLGLTKNSKPKLVTNYLIRLEAQIFWARSSYTKITLPLLTTSLLPDLIASHFRTDCGLFNQVGSTTDHLTNYCIRSTRKDQSMTRAELIGAIANNSKYMLFVVLSLNLNRKLSL